MDTLIYIVAADEEEYAEVAESAQPLDEWSGIQQRGLDTAQIVMLHCLVTGDELDLALGAYEPVYVAEDSGTLVLRIAGEAVAKLAELEEESLERVAEELAATEDFEYAQWDAEAVLDLVMELADLARLAEAQGQALFVWMRPLSG